MTGEEFVKTAVKMNVVKDYMSNTILAAKVLGYHTYLNMASIMLMKHDYFFNIEYNMKEDQYYLLSTINMKDEKLVFSAIEELDKKLIDLL